MDKGLGINSRPALTKWGWPARIGLGLAAILFGWSVVAVLVKQHSLWR